MPSRQIPAEDWRSFLDSFSRQHQGWLVSVERVSPRGRLIEVHDRPLNGVLAEGASSIVVLVGADPDNRLSHTIAGPRCLSFLQNEAGADEGLEIVDSGGETTVLRFRAPMRPETIDGIAA